MKEWEREKERNKEIVKERKSLFECAFDRVHDEKRLKHLITFDSRLLFWANGPVLKIKKLLTSVLKIIWKP